MMNARHFLANSPHACYNYSMTITQTVEIPANSRSITVEVPREIPSGPVILTFTPASAEPQATFEESITEKLNGYYQNHTSRLDADLKTASYRLLAKADW